MTGCGCVGVVAALVLLIAFFVRSSFDAGDPVGQAAALAVFLACVELWRRERSTHELVRARGA